MIQKANTNMNRTINKAITVAMPVVLEEVEKR